MPISRWISVSEREDHDIPYLYGQPELEPVQGVADADLPLDLHVGEGRHDTPYLYSQPELEPVQGVADAYLLLDLRIRKGRP
jgi:hypothetical protein